MYIQCTHLYHCIIECCHGVAPSHVQCSTDGYRDRLGHFMKLELECTDIQVAEPGTYIIMINISFSSWLQLFDSPCWLACRLRLAAASLVSRLF